MAQNKNMEQLPDMDLTPKIHKSYINLFVVALPSCSTIHLCKDVYIFMYYTVLYIHVIWILFSIKYSRISQN